MIIKNKGRQFHDSPVVNIPTQTITNDKPIKKSRSKNIEGIDAERNNLRNKYDELNLTEKDLFEQLEKLGKELHSTTKRNEKSLIKKQIAELDSLVYENKNNKQQIEKKLQELRMFK